MRYILCNLNYVGFSLFVMRGFQVPDSTFPPTEDVSRCYCVLGNMHCNIHNIRRFDFCMDPVFIEDGGDHGLITLSNKHCAYSREHPQTPNISLPSKDIPGGFCSKTRYFSTLLNHLGGCCMLCNCSRQLLEVAQP